MKKKIASLLSLCFGLALGILIVSGAYAAQAPLAQTDATVIVRNPGGDSDIEGDFRYPPADEPIIWGYLPTEGDPGPAVHHPAYFMEGILGDLERTTQFDIIPGSEFTFDQTLWNTESLENSAHVLLTLDYPDGSVMTILDEIATLEGDESQLTQYSSLIPEDLDIYGRYTMKLLIDDRLEDWFWFDLNPRDQIVVRWDDGVLDDMGAWYDAGDKWAIRGCMPPGAVIDSIGAYIVSEGDEGFWPWPDRNHQDISLEIYDTDGPGEMPGTLLYADMTRAVAGTSHAVAYPNISTPHTAFFVVNHQTTPYPQCEAQGLDEGFDHLDQMFEQDDGVWDNYEAIVGGDFMIWAVGHAGGQRITVGNPPNGK